jgi:hypothetical protein
MLKVFFLIFILDGNDFWIKTSSYESCQEMHSSFQSQNIWSACVEGESEYSENLHTR